MRSLTEWNLEKRRKRHGRGSGFKRHVELPSSSWVISDLFFCRCFAWESCWGKHLLGPQLAWIRGLSGIFFLHVNASRRAGTPRSGWRGTTLHFERLVARWTHSLRECRQTQIGELSFSSLDLRSLVILSPRRPLLSILGTWQMLKGWVRLLVT